MLELDASREPVTIVAANHRAALMYGRPIEDLAGLPLHALHEPHAAAAHKQLLALARAGLEAQCETLHLNIQGERLAVRLHAGRPSEGDTAVLLIIENITAEIEMRSQFDAIDEDRRRIAHELHDTLAQDLAAIRMEIALWRDVIGADMDTVARDMDTMVLELKEKISQTRRAIFALRPVELDHLGLVATLKSLATRMNRHFDLLVELNLSYLGVNLPSSVELQVLRIIQEALNNAARHSGARRVALTLRSCGTALQIEVEDDGAGFATPQPGAQAGPRSYGLLHLRERARSIGAEIAIVSEPGRGTRVHVLLPGWGERA